VLPVLVAANVVPGSSIVTLRIEAIRSSVLTTATRRGIAEDGILHRHRRENLRYYSCFPHHSYSALPLPHVKDHHRIAAVQKRANWARSVAQWAVLFHDLGFPEPRRIQPDLCGGGWLM
jgi:hypothetical protein